MIRQQTIEVAGLQVELVRKPVRNLNLTVNGPSGKLRLSLPRRVSEQEARRFIESKLAWIERHQARLARMPAVTAARYVSGEVQLFQGREYRLQVSETAKGGVRLNGDDLLHLFVPGDADTSQRRDVLESWYREQLQILIPPLIETHEPRMGVRVAEWRVRKMKTRWGSCNIAKRRLWINLELAKLPPACLEYIVVHEMAHLLERGHNRRFYALMDRYLSDWRQAEAMLKRYSIN